MFSKKNKKTKSFGGFEIVGNFVAEFYIWFVQYSKNRGARKRSLNKRFGGFASRPKNMKVRAQDNNHIVVV